MANIQDFKGRKVHMIGIGGSSMSGLADVLLSLGYKVSGSDIAWGHYTQSLIKKGVEIKIGHNPDMLKDAALVIYSAAINKKDTEMLEAEKLKIPTMERAELLGQLMEFYKTKICVCGTHGKTTQSSMIAQIAVDAKLEPGVHIGGQFPYIGGSSLVGKRDYYIAEACEFNRSFMHMPPDIVVLLNIDYDHLDYYKTFENLKNAFLEFANKIPESGLLIYNNEDESCREIASKVKCRVQSVGFQSGTWQAKNIVYGNTGGSSFDVYYENELVQHVSLKVAGNFNIFHATASLAVAKEAGIKSGAAAQSLSQFSGASRRNEYTGTVKGMLMYHDYGHNAKEMRGAISVAKKLNRRLIAVMQPHTFSRVINSFEDMALCTKEADITLVSDICPARETDPGTIHSKMLVDKMLENGIDAHYTASFDDIENWLLENGKAGDVVLTMGCGDINDLNIQMQEHFDGRKDV